MADEVNQYAFEGGDTEAETAAEIKKRNEALQTYSDKNNELFTEIGDKQNEVYAAAVEAEKQVAESTNALVTGEPVGGAEPIAKEPSKKQAASKS